MEIKEKEILRCKRECVMDDDSVSTTKGKLYSVQKDDDGMYYIIDDENLPHHFENNSEDGWEVYFEKTRDLKLERILNLC